MIALGASPGAPGPLLMLFLPRSGQGENVAKGDGEDL